jgi:hypothetical protein
MAREAVESEVPQMDRKTREVVSRGVYNLVDKTPARKDEKNGDSSGFSSELTLRTTCRVEAVVPAAP